MRISEDGLGVQFVPDEGLQAERTALAWQRTALVLAATAAGVLRLVAYRAGAFALAACGIVAVAGVVVVVITRRRYRSTNDAVLRDVNNEADAGVFMPGARLPLFVVVITIVLGVVELMSMLFPTSDL